MKIKENIIKTVSKTKFALKKNAPEIMVVAGVVGVVTSAVIACVKTTKVNDILEKSSDRLENVNKEDKKELTIAYAKTGWEMIRLYSPAVALGTVSVVSILAGHNMLKKRNVALAAAYATVDAGFKEYRKNVVERFGEEVDEELKYGSKKQKIEETIVDENGKVKKIKKEVSVTNLNDHSEYAIYFDERSTYYDEVSDYNWMLINGVENNCNDLLRIQGYLTLNYVLDKLGLEPTASMRKAGMVVGWIYEKDNQIGDNYIDFHAKEVYRNREDGTVEKAILLDFNVDGNIYDRM